ncbi:IS30 family transposase [Lactiplantibacillus pingfangensis]|uniref:IS30 family transposase n=1 Tax=Lactiplantibacillus pingfangensis TaxID=2559915 RepID=UPI0010F5D081|nr:IS30 family transposase [Lactiplantibacillus pingfangensis]
MTQLNITTTHNYQQLSEAERGAIQAFHEDHDSIRAIAERLHRSPSTISRELKRGTVRQLNSDYLPYYQYFAEAGQANYLKHRENCHANGLLNRCWLFFSMLCKALKKHIRWDSIDSFVHRFRRDHPDKPCPSTPTVYRYIDMGLLDLNNSDLPMKLRRRVKGSHKPHIRMNKKNLGTSIDDRPNYIDDRLLLGDWEGDLVKGKRVASEPAIMTLTERLSRFEIIVKIPDYHAETCRDALQAIINQYGRDKFHSITFDNGSEFSLLNQVHGTQVYFAHPYSPWERGSNENQNGLIREFMPKGKSMKIFTESYITEVQAALNNRLRKSLGYLSSSEAFKLFSPIKLTLH